MEKWATKSHRWASGSEASANDGYGVQSELHQDLTRRGLNSRKPFLPYSFLYPTGNENNSRPSLMRNCPGPEKNRKMEILFVF